MSEMIKFLKDSFDTPFFTIVGGISTIITIVGILYAVYLFVKGVAPVLIRLGMRLSKRKIAIFAENEYGALKALLCDSKLFAGTVQIHKNSLKSAETQSVFLVYWPEFKDKIDEIIQIKKDSTAMIVYAPQSHGRIDDEDMKKINNQRNSIVVNLRGRLLNDILVSLITSA